MIQMDSRITLEIIQKKKETASCKISDDVKNRKRSKRERELEWVLQEVSIRNERTVIP